LVRDLAVEVGVGRVERNPFRSILVRGLEVLYAVIEAERIIAGYTRPARPFVEVPARAGTGHGCTEAPRGILYHRYETDLNGVITSARIVPPTAQNQPAIEADLRQLVEAFLANSADVGDVALLEERCETAIRNYDPCISCATHFLSVTIDQDGDST
jgi:coenzyme F420-reducing hydrogenase alpha subunit